jgi:hypothetical protein
VFRVLYVDGETIAFFRVLAESLGPLSHGRFPPHHIPGSKPLKGLLFRQGSLRLGGLRIISFEERLYDVSVLRKAEPSLPHAQQDRFVFDGCHILREAYALLGKPFEIDWLFHFIPHNLSILCEKT